MDSWGLTVECSWGHIRYSTLFMHFAFVSVSFYRSLVLLGSHGTMITRNEGHFRYSMLLSRFRFIQVVYNLQHYTALYLSQNA